MLTFLMIVNFMSAGAQLVSALDAAAEGNGWGVLIFAAIGVFNFAVGRWTLKTRDEF